jgi:hypothetical protein
MARIFNRSAPPAESRSESLGTGLTAARMLAAAVAALLVSLLVMARSDAALVARSGNLDNEFGPGVVEVDDDGGGLRMFDVDDLVPGRPVAECISVRYTGTVSPAVVRLTAISEGALAGDLLLRIETGTGGRYGDCSGFRRTGLLYDGVLSGLPAPATATGAGLEVFRPTGAPQLQALRFTADLREGSDPDGARALADFFWEATPD